MPTKSMKLSDNLTLNINQSSPTNTNELVPILLHSIDTTLNTNSNVLNDTVIIDPNTQPSQVPCNKTVTSTKITQTQTSECIEDSKTIFNKKSTVNTTNNDFCKSIS
jgi:hypothetical protein